MDYESRLILARTHKDRIKEGLTVMLKGEGVWVFDQDGKRYLDLEAGMTRPVHVGYGRKEIAQAAYDQMVELCYFTPMEFANGPAIQLANGLSEITPEKINQFFFVSSGSEAVESAIKLAKHHHFFKGDRKRYKIISRRGAYHGVTGGALNLLGTIFPMRQIMEPLGPGTIFVESPYCYRCPLHLSYPHCDIACANPSSRALVRMLLQKNIGKSSGKSAIDMESFSSSMKSSVDLEERANGLESTISTYSRT